MKSYSIADPDKGLELTGEIQARLQSSLGSSDRIPFEEVKNRLSSLTYHVQFTPQALEDLSELDTPIARRIVEKIQWLAEHFDQIQPGTLTGPFASLFKLRVADWRVLYTTDPARHTLTIHVIAHRSKVYKSSL